MRSKSGCPVCGSGIEPFFAKTPNDAPIGIESFGIMFICKKRKTHGISRKIAFEIGLIKRNKRS